jgi:hypothetical protein
MCANINAERLHGADEPVWMSYYCYDPILLNVAITMNSPVVNAVSNTVIVLKKSI